MFEVTVLTTLELDQDPQSALKNKMGDFDEADLQKAYAQSQGKGDETLTIASISHQIGSKFQAQTKIASHPGLKIATSEYSSITSGLTLEAAEDDDIYRIGVTFLALDPVGDNISPLGEDSFLTGGNICSPEDDSL